MVMALALGTLQIACTTRGHGAESKRGRRGTIQEEHRNISLRISDIAHAFMYYVHAITSLHPFFRISSIHLSKGVHPFSSMLIQSSESILSATASCLHKLRGFRLSFSVLTSFPHCAENCIEVGWLHRLPIVGKAKVQTSYILFLLL